MVSFFVALFLGSAVSSNAASLHRMKLSRTPLAPFDPAAAAIQLSQKYGSSGSSAVASLTKELETAATIGNGTFDELPDADINFLSTPGHSVQLNSKSLNVPYRSRSEALHRLCKLSVLCRHIVGNASSEGLCLSRLLLAFLY